MLIYVKVNKLMLISNTIHCGVKVLDVLCDCVSHTLILTVQLLVIHGLLVCSVQLLCICMVYSSLDVLKLGTSTTLKSI